MSNTFLYRKNGGQVVGITTDATTYSTIDATYWATVTDPQLPDGNDIGIAKIYDGTTTPATVRNAISTEVTNFVTAQSTDENLQQRTGAKGGLTADPTFRKLMRAFLDVLLGQLNILRANDNLSAITMTQAVTAIQNKIDAGTYD